MLLELLQQPSRLGESFGVAADDAFAPLGVLGHESGILEGSDVLLHGRERHVVVRGQRRNRCRFAREQSRDDIPSRGIGQGPEEPIDIGIGEWRTYNHVVVR